MANAIFNIKVQGLDATTSKIKGKVKSIETQVQNKLTEFALHTVADASRNVPVDEGHLKNSIKPEISKLKVSVVVAANYAAYVEFGTKGFAAQYVSSLPSEWQAFAAQFKGGGGGGSIEEFILRIMDWVKRKGIAGTYSVKTQKRTKASGKGQDFEDAEVAYPIALSILRKGIRAHPFLYPAFEKNRIELIREMKLIK